MNWLLPVTVAVILICAWNGHSKGFIKKSVGIISWVVIIWLTSVINPVVLVLLEGYTSLGSSIQKSLTSSDTELLEAMSVLGLEDLVGGYISDLILQALSFLITLLLVGVLIKGILFALGIVARLPVLSGLNRLAGLVLGFAEGVLLIWIFFFVVTVCSSMEWGGTLLKMIAGSEFLTWLYRNNLLFLLL